MDAEFDEHLLKLSAGGKSIPEIAETLARTDRAIALRLERHGVLQINDNVAVYCDGRTFRFPSQEAAGPQSP